VSSGAKGVPNLEGRFVTSNSMSFAGELVGEFKCNAGMPGEKLSILSASQATFMETTPKVKNEKIVMSGIKIARITCMVEGKMYSEDLKLEISGNVVFLLPDSTQATEGTTMMVIKSDPQWQIVKSPVTLVGQLGE
ncbi:hypothetical protein OJ252_3719, partial [Cryptosporidium canis]